MALFALSDLHLTFQVEKPMEVFGAGWQNYVSRIEENWRKTVSEEDTVLIPGDVSWGTYLTESKKDFEFINSLPGTKYISKGNHDYWWETVTKMNGFLADCGFDTMKFVYNSAFLAEGCAICASKGYERETEERLKARELMRLEMSLKEGRKISSGKLVAMLHYPPFYKNGEQILEISELLKKYDAGTCIYGHIHSKEHNYPVNETIDGINYMLVSADRINFCPVRVALS